MKAQIVLGPPGTGKTTRLLDEVDAAIEDGIAPDEIAFLTFARKAAGEAKTRAMDKFGLMETELPYFRTLHSFRYFELGLTAEEVVSEKHFEELGRIISMDFTSRGFDAEEGMPMGDADGDACRRVDHLARNRLVTLDQQLREMQESVSIHEIELFAKAYRDYKTRRGLIDFTDMLEADVVPRHFRLLIIDEAQDMTPLQWQVARQLIDAADRAIVAGDDDQAIFEWAGGNPEPLMESRPIVLSKSYRLPSKVWALADTISKRIERRAPKTWAPRDAEGEIHHAADIGDIDMAEGEWLLLARNAYLLKHYVEHLRDAGYLYRTKQGSSISPSVAKAIVWWNRLLKGQSAKLEDVIAIYDLMRAGDGYERGSRAKLTKAGRERLTLVQLQQDFGLLADGPWFEVLTKLGEDEISYIRSALSNGEKIGAERIMVSTIHGAKGGEADNVVVMPDMAYRTFQAFEEQADPEHRVFYVGVTRTRNRLFLLDARGNNFYSF